MKRAELLACVPERPHGEPAHAAALQEQLERHLAAAEQRIVRGEQLLTRLAMLSEDRESFGLGNAPTDLLIGKISRKLEQWTIHRDVTFPVLHSQPPA